MQVTLRRSSAPSCLHLNDRSFSYYAPILWNSLPKEFRHSAAHSTLLLLLLFLSWLFLLLNFILSSRLSSSLILTLLSLLYIWTDFLVLDSALNFHVIMSFVSSHSPHSFSTCGFNLVIVYQSKPPFIHFCLFVCWVGFLHALYITSFSVIHFTSLKLISFLVSSHLISSFVSLERGAVVVVGCDIDVTFVACC